MLALLLLALLDRAAAGLQEGETGRMVGGMAELLGGQADTAYLAQLDTCMQSLHPGQSMYSRELFSCVTAPFASSVLAASL